MMGVITKVVRITEGEIPQDSRHGRPLLVEGLALGAPVFFEITAEAAEEFKRLLAAHPSCGK
jgi:hypothetical protein